jgi:hypothetical protein
MSDEIPGAGLIGLGIGLGVAAIVAKPIVRELQKETKPRKRRKDSLF